VEAKKPDALARRASSSSTANAYMTDASWVGMDAMGELCYLLGWAFTGNAENFASRLVQWSISAKEWLNLWPMCVAADR
jgi:hypothetical protein